MTITKCECGGRLDVVRTAILVTIAPVNPKTGEWGKAKKVCVVDEDGGIPKFICRKCKREWHPVFHRWPQG